MFISYALRLLLIVNGGQLYHPDELRYYRSIEVTKHIFNGDVKNAVKTLLKYEFHQGISIAKLIPALFHRVIHSLNSDDNLLWKDLWHTPPQNFRLPALLFALPSVLSIGMIYVIQREAGADSVASLLGAFLLATSHSFFFFAKHLLPYDIAILIGLIAIYFALRRRQARLVNGLWIGFLAFLVFWIYNGYVTLSITIGVLYCVLLAHNIRDMLWRALGIVAGALLFFVPIFAFNLVFLQENIILQMLTFSETVNHGEFAEGIVFPFLYFRDTEGALGLVWSIGLALAFRQLLHETPSGKRWRIRSWIACMLILYLLMIIFSAVLQQFVLYGRIVRSLAPFVAMACACAYAPYILRYGRAVAALTIAGMSALAIANFIPTIQQQYPLEIAWQVYQEYDEVSFETTVETGDKPVFHWWNLQPERPGARYRLLNAANFYPIIAINSEVPEGKVLWAIDHPLQYKPWQYEGLSLEERDLVNRSDVRIWFIENGESDD